MSDSEIRRAFRRERWNTFVVDLKKGGWVVVLLVAALGLYVLLEWSPRRVVASEFGRVEGVAHLQREDGPPLRRLNVKLDSGAYATVSLPRAALYRAGARIEVRVIERDWIPSLKRYEFVRYAPDGSVSDP